MPNSIQELYKEYENILDSQVFNPEELDYHILDYHIPLLESIDVVDSGCISIFDLYKRNHVYYSPKYFTVLGWDPKRAQTDLEYTNSMIHPDDLYMLLKAGMYFMSFGFAFEDKKKSKAYKAIFDYRIRGKNGNYVRII